MWINYRKPEDAVVDTSRKNRYGYFATLRVPHARSGQEMLVVTSPPDRGVWPLTVQMEVKIHNHEDLQHFVDCLIQAYDETRGEFGEFENISPSEFQAKIHKIHGG